MEVEVRVAGIPAIARVGSVYRAGDGWHEPRTIEFNYVLLDRRGRRARWLDHKLENWRVAENVDEQIMGVLGDD
jgi:hypothetical protein